MDRRQLLLGMTALGLTRNLTLPDFLNAQNVEIGDSLLSTNSVNTSDRERDGLRGPVRISLEEVGSDFGKTRTTNEYDLDGRLLASKSTYSGGSESENTRTYDAAGRLLRTSNKSDGSSSVQIYSYDERGRLLSTADSNGSRTDFHYDSEGRKTEKQTIPHAPEKRRRRPSVLVQWLVRWKAATGCMTGARSRSDTTITICQSNQKF